MTNSRLKAMFSLRSKITVYTPATVNINEVIDNSKYVDYAGEDDLKKNLDKVIDFCENLKNEMSQDAVALELNGEMFFI